MFYLKTTYQKMVKTKDTQFCVKNMKMKKEKKLTFRRRDLNPRFSVIFLPIFWVFMEGEVQILTRKLKILDFTWSANSVQTLAKQTQTSCPFISLKLSFN